MKNCVIITEKELQICLILLHAQGLAGVTEINEDFNVTEEERAQMLAKGYIEPMDNGYNQINKFVEFVLWNAVHASARLIQTGADGSVCNFYLRGETIIYIEKDASDEHFFIYWIPFITGGIGAMALHYEYIPEKYDSDGGILSKPSENDSGKVPTGAGDAAPAEVCVRIEGVRGNDEVYHAALSQSGGIYYFTDGNEELPGPVTSYDFVQRIAQWLIASHGYCLKMKEV